MTTLWKAIVCLFHRSECDSGFRGDETTDFMSDTKRRARDQELAAWREVDRISQTTDQDQRGVADVISRRARRD